MTTVALSISIGAGAVADCAEGMATREARGEHMPMTEGPVDIRTTVLDTGMAGGWMVVPRGYDNLTANLTVGAKEDAVGIPPVVGSRGCWHACSQLYVSCTMGLY